jgi:hypothetical protein
MTSLAVYLWKNGVFSMFRAMLTKPHRTLDDAGRGERLRAIDTRNLSVDLQQDIGLRDGRPFRKGP